MKYLIFVLLLCFSLSWPQKYCVFYIGYEYEVNLVPKKLYGCLAYAEYNDSLLESGWDTLYVSFDEDLDRTDDYDSMYAAGLLEGYLTQKRMWDHYRNMRYYLYPETHEMPEATRKFLEENLQFVEDNYQKHVKNATDRKSPEFLYWNSVTATMRQFKGMVDGYNAAAPSNSMKLDYFTLNTLTSYADVRDLNNLKKENRPDFSSMSAAELMKHLELRSSCSALIKASPDLKEVYFGHNTWTTFASMNRIVKRYEFPIIGSVAKTIVMTSYPGYTYSADDYHIIDDRLVVIETTNAILNTDLYDLFDPKTVLIWPRVMTANRLARDGKEWTELFSKNNSGTYNNQYMVSDLTKMDLDKGIIHDGALWISEQIPGYIRSQDVTDYLRNGYWPSYNTLFNKELAELAGIYDAIRNHPELKDKLDHETCVRANIFRRDQGKVDSIEAFNKLMRFNDYKNDPLSKNTPSFAIACRADLLKENGHCSGATDAKTSKASELKNATKKFHLIVGPTKDQPPLDWDSRWCTGLPYYGLKDKHIYDWVEYSWTD